MTRKKVEQVIGSWDEADAMLRELGAIEQRTAATTATANRRISEITQGLQDATADDAKRAKGIVVMLEQFAETHRDELDGKSRALAAGTIGFRMTPPALKCARGVTWDDLTNTLIRMKRDDLVIYATPKPNKDAVKRLAEDEPRVFAKLPVEIVQKDEFFAEPLIVEPAHHDAAV